MSLADSLGVNLKRKGIHWNGEVDEIPRDAVLKTLDVSSFEQGVCSFLGI